MLKKANLLLIEGKKSGAAVFYSSLNIKGFNITLASNGIEIDEFLDRAFPDLIIINSASMRTSGRRIFNNLASTYNEIPIILILESEENKFKLTSNVNVLAQPFTIQKLINTIKRSIHIESRNLLQAGPIRLDLINNWVQIKDRKIQLTPQLVLLLSAMMAAPGETISREDLFRKVWETDYVMDMRTLDVHISWLRKAIELNPRKPVYILTKRGVGYRLEIPGTDQKNKQQ